MNYFQFLIQWYNWPYLAGLGMMLLSLAYRPFLAGLGRAAGRRLGLTRTAGHSVVRTFGTTVAVVGLTVNGALHDYWPSGQEWGFVPGLAFTLSFAAYVTKRFGRFRERTFPPIRAVGLGARDLTGLEGRVVSRSVDSKYRAGRAQVMDSEETLHIVMCKTTGKEIPYGARVVLGEYDPADGRYYVERLDAPEEASDSSAGSSE